MFHFYADDGRILTPPKGLNNSYTAFFKIVGHIRFFMQLMKFGMEGQLLFLNRPAEQLNLDLNEYPSGIRCDMCLLHISQDENDFEGSKEFPIIDRNCYFGAEEGRGEAVFHHKGVTVNSAT
jgi:hypothetical protein